MKWRNVLQVIANTCFWIGDKFSKGANYENIFGLACWNQYQQWMRWSDQIQQKYKLDGPWKYNEEEE